MNSLLSGKATASERFAFMLLDRLQVVEGSVALLEQAATTDELSAEVQPVAKGGIFEGGGVGQYAMHMEDPMAMISALIRNISGSSSVDWAAVSAQYGRALLAAGVDAAEVRVGLADGVAPGGEDAMPLNAMLKRMSMAARVVVRLRGRHLVPHAVERLTTVMEAAGLPVRQASSWTPRELRMPSNADDNAKWWTWEAPTHDKQDAAAAAAAAQPAETEPKLPSLEARLGIAALFLHLQSAQVARA
jgi:hypothetical protein